MRGAADAVAGWMRAAGMSVRRDNIGNLIGRYEAERAGAKTVLLGSHLDTVRDAGKYDGALGVLVALACVERLHARRERLPFAVEVIGFADEEGLRYHSTHLGFALLRHAALNLLRHESSLRCAVKAKRMRAGWDTASLLKVVASI
jgi:allantoate deiminase